MKVPALEWREAARADLLAIVGAISDNNAKAAQRLKDDVEARISKLPTHPKRYKTGRVAGTRELIIRPNTIVIYMENSDTVSVLRVLHAAQQWP